ncbi:unnamed protein product [Symbiodinium sp. CCMP2592]|nr:unnamed protein product [Symbiodinium sp. CCMP2592]
MPRTPKWIPCACGYHWAWKRQVESGENTHCACCGRNWQKQLNKQQASKEARAEQSQSPRAVWEDGRTKGKGKGEGKGSKNPPGGKVGAVLAGLWKDLPEAAQKAFQEVGYSPPRPKGPPPPPPGLDLQSLLKGRMTEKEYNAARAVVYAGAGLHVQTLLEEATNQMKNLVEKKAKLQVDKDIKAKDVEIQETAKAFKEMTADSTSTAFSALEAVLSEAGHELNEATRAKMKAALVGKEDLPPDPFIVSFRGHDEYFPREMPPMYGPARTDSRGKRPTPLEGTKPEGAAGSDNPE